MPDEHTPSARHPIRAVARITGLSIDTLRAWERRYHAVAPGRSDRGRLYTDGDIARLRRLSELVGRGHAIGTIAHLPDDELDRRLADSVRLSLSATPAPKPAANLRPLIEALERYDLTGVERALNSYAAVLPPRDLVVAILVPLLRQIGQQWDAGTLRPAQEHLISAIVRSVLGGLLRAAMRPEATPKMVFATPAGERHELGLLCAALLAAASGRGVVYLGADLPAADIWHAVEESASPVLVLALTTPGAVTRAELKALATPPHGVELWIGGPAANDLLVLSGPAGRHVEDIDDITEMQVPDAR